MINGRFRNFWDFLRRGLKARPSPYQARAFTVGFPRYHYELEYCEGERRLLFAVDRDGGKKWWDVWMVIYFPKYPRWQSPFESDAIDEEKAAQIRANIIQAAVAKEWAYEIKDDNSNPVFDP